MGGLAQFVKDVGAVQFLEGVTDTVGTLRHFNAFADHFLNLGHGILGQGGNC